MDLSLPTSHPKHQIVRALEHLHSKLSVIHRGQCPLLQETFLNNLSNVCRSFYRHLHICIRIHWSLYYYHMQIIVSRFMSP